MTIRSNRVIFRCLTCEKHNINDAGLPDFIEYQVMFESLTDAWLHIGQVGDCHDLIAEFSPSNEP
jgi:hypothetical protein